MEGVAVSIIGGSLYLGSIGFCDVREQQNNQIQSIVDDLFERCRPELFAGNGSVHKKEIIESL